jgi:hypothetical protein
MAVMWMMEPSVYEIIDMVPVWDAFVSAVRPMHMRTLGVQRAPRGIGVADLDDVFVDMVAVHVMQMTIVDIIDVAIMAHCCVPAVRTMLMSVIRMVRVVA